MFEGLHIRYNIRSQKFKKLIRDIQDGGHEIGLHSSLKAFDHPQQYNREKSRIEDVTVQRCAGLRQHYLRAKFPRFWRLASNAGFEYDSSLGYNFQAGFRAGTCWPFRVFDYQDDKLLPLTELPLTFFEYNLPARGEDSSSEDMISNMIEQVSRYNGLLVALLHPSNYLREPYQSLWNHLIQGVEKHAILVDTLSGINQWFTIRREIVMEWQSGSSGEIILQIRKPSEVKQFALEFITPVNLKGPSSVKITWLDQKSCVIKSRQKNIQLNISKS
jgi:hypothetical protein